MDRKYNVTVYGASGYTGQFVIKELAVYHSEITWCVAGRSIEKLKSVLNEIGKDLNKNLDNVDIIRAENGDEQSLAEMCINTDVVINCVGPYRFFGEKVTEQCVKNGAHHIDISGEPQFLESMQLKFFDEAKEKGVYIIGSCGFDSIPCDLGVEIVRKKFEGDVHSVETYFIDEREPGSTVNFATWQSAIHGLYHASELAPLRKMLKEKVFPKCIGSLIDKPEYKMEKRFLLHKSEVVNGWCLPFIGSDRSVILRTQMFNYNFKNERPVQVQCYVKTSSLLNGIVTIFMGAIFMLMTTFSMGCYFLERFPELFSLGVFSRNPPAKGQGRLRRLTSWLPLMHKKNKCKNMKGQFSIVYNVKGWSEKLLDASDRHTTPPNKAVTAILKGPDPGYLVTAICVVNSALVVLQERDKLPLSGGVLTPGAAFSNTSLMRRLESRGLTISGLKSVP